MKKKIYFASLRLCVKIFLLSLLSFSVVKSQTFSQLEKDFLNPPQSAKPWVFWYWLHGAVSKEGITADLEAMKEVGLGGAYLMFIKDTNSTKVAYQPQVSQLSKEWFTMVAFAIQEAKRFNIQLGVHVSDGFALAGGPWITPELSMKKIVGSKTFVKAGQKNIQLLQPETNANYYKDIAVYAYSTNTILGFEKDVKIKVSSSIGKAPQTLAYVVEKADAFKTDSNCYIQYEYEKAFTMRSVTIFSNNNYQAVRFLIRSSNDGINFTDVIQLVPPRHGWQDADEPYTFSIPATTAKYFRFVFDKTASEPGAEDLDAAKWKPNLKVKHIILNDESTIDNFQAKNGSVWRIASSSVASNTHAIPQKNFINLTNKVDKSGLLHYTFPKGNFVIVRLGVTTTAHKNETAGGGKGLECDKFNAAAVELQYKNWFDKIYNCVDTATAKDVIKLFHVDSWECGSQNWSTNFSTEFKKRRGYDLIPFLPVMMGIPMESVAKSEQVLYDIRQTIAELINDVFYTTLKKIVEPKGILFSAESVAPTMMSDGMLHYKNVNMPMGEFWNNSPTHDKPNDMLDAISAAHIYGKQIVQAEAFTTLRMNWNEHPANLKVLGDRNFALGINKMVLHVMMHNPWVNKQPGITLDPIGLYYQRNQTWFKQSKVWIDYMARCQAILQQGKPVVDIAVFTGEELPRRSVLPNELVSIFPGIVGKERVESEKKRLANINQPLRKIPDEITHSANVYDANDWVNPLDGYNYDSFNPDVLQSMNVANGNVVTKGGMSYKILVIPAHTKMNPASIVTERSIKKIVELVKAGATVLIDSFYRKEFFKNGVVFHFVNDKKIIYSIFGKGKFVLTPFVDESFKVLGVDRDVEITNDDIKYSDIAFTHRKVKDVDVYFISNQTSKETTLQLKLKCEDKEPEIWNTYNAFINLSQPASFNAGKTKINLYLAAYESKFIVLKKKVVKPYPEFLRCGGFSEDYSISKRWKIKFDTSVGGAKDAITLDSLVDLTTNINPQIKYYSGTAIYSNTFIDSLNTTEKWLNISSVNNMATVKINGIDCGTLWTPPYQLNISKAVKQGLNTIEIAVTNTWNNRLILDSLLPPEKRITYTMYPFVWSKKSLQPAGIIGDVTITSY